MSVRNTGVPYYLGQDVGSTVGTGAQTGPWSGNSTNLYDIIVNGDVGRRNSFVTNDSAYTTTPVSLSVFFGHSGPGSGTNQTPKSGPGYTKNNATYVATLTKLGTNTLNGGVLAGTNGDFESFFVGRDAAGNHYYAATFQSHAWRPGANLYRMRADGGNLQRVYSHHHLSDMIPVNSQSGGPMSNISSNTGSGWLFYSVRRDIDGRPRIMVTSWSAGNIYDGQTINSSIVGSNNVPQTLLSGVDAWGQVSDAINIPNTDDRYTTGATLYIRSNQGPRIVFAKRNGAGGILNQHTRNMAAFNDPPFVYDNGVIDHNSGCVGGLCFSPGTSRIYTIFTYEQRNGSFTGGENLLINFTNVGSINGTSTVTTDPPRLGLIHFIWGEGGGCRPDWGTFTASHICYLDTISGTDRLAYAFTKIAVSIRGFNSGVANGLYFRITNANPLNNVYPAAESDQCGEYPTLYQQYVTSAVNYYQKIRVRKMGVQRVHNSANSLTETWYWIALSWVDSSQRIRVRIWRANFATNTFQQMHDFTAIDSFRGMAAFNGTHSVLTHEPQHLFVFGTNNTGLQNTETYASGKAYNPGVEHDMSKSIRFV
jgi:hypothetical protein